MSNRHDWRVLLAVALICAGFAIAVSTGLDVDAIRIALAAVALAVGVATWRV